MKPPFRPVILTLVLLLPLAGVARLAGCLPWRLADWVVALGLLVSPAVALGALWNPFRTGTWRAMGLHLLTVIAGGVALMVILRSLGVPAPAASAALVLVSAAVGVLALTRLRRLQWQAEPADAVYLGLALLFVALVCFRVGTSFSSMMSAHGLWHVACATKTLAAVPPECPAFAGYPYYMYWAYDVYLVQLGLATNRTLGEIALLTSLLALPVAAAAYGLGCVLFSSERWRWVYALATMAGLNGAASVLLALRLAAHPGQWAGYLTYERLNELAISYKWNGCIFSLPVGYTGGAGMGLALFLGAVYLAVDTTVRGVRGAQLALMALLIAAALMVHPVSGAVAFVAAVVLAAVAFVASEHGSGQRRGAVLLALAGCAGVAICIPYLRTMMGEYGDPPFLSILNQPRVMAKQVWDLAGPWLWTLALVPLGVVQILRRRQPQAVPFLVMSALLGLMAVALRLPWDNQYKFVYLQAPFVCAVALVGLSSLPWRGLRRAATGLLVCVLLASMLAGGAVNRLRYATKPFFYAASGSRVVMLDQTGDVAALWQWVAAHTDPQAVVIEAPYGLDTETTLLEPTIVAGRTGFTSTAGRAYVPYTKESWETGGYRDCELREALANALSAGQRLSKEQWAYLRDMRRPLYLLLRAENKMVRPEADAALLADPAHFRPAFSRGSVRLYQIVPG